MWTPGINVPSYTGRFRYTLDGDDWKVLKAQHGKNAYNCAILIESWVSLLADSPSSGLLVNSTFRRFCKSLVCDLHGVIKNLSRVAHQLMLSVTHTDSGTCIRPLIDEFRKLPVFREYLFFLRHFKSSESFSFLLSFLLFGKKLYYEDEAVDAAALRGWLDNEERLASVTLPSWAGKLKMVVERALKTFNHVPLPAHGGGKVAEPGITTVRQKSDSMQPDPRIPYLFSSGISPYANASYLPYGGSWPRGTKVVPFSRRARLKMVHKYIGTKRPISIEPAPLQYTQQSVRRALELAISSGFLGKFVRIDDQSTNQEGSRVGSYSSMYDTIDLSSASDSVLYTLVKKAFPAKVLRFLAGTRSTETLLPNGDTHVHLKFAPMGSATCFPVQSVLFASVVMLAQTAHHFSVDVDQITARQLESVITHTPDTWELTSGLRSLRVYGDDIICDSRVTHIVIGMLRQLGFMVNETKSFTGDSAFRESCGKYHLDGADVTPVFCRVGKSTDKTIDIKRYSSIVELCNLSRSKRYFHCATYLQLLALKIPVNGLIKEHGCNPLLFSSVPGNLSIWTPAPKNNHLRCRYYNHQVVVASRRLFTVLLAKGFFGLCAKLSRFLGTSSVRYQRDEVKSIGVAQKVEVDVIDDYNYLIWQRSKASRTESSDDFVTESSASNVLNAYARWRWTPA